MSNKTLVWMTSAPMITTFVAGLLDIPLDDGATTLLGIWTLGFGTWAMIRLYKYDIPSKAEAA